VRFTTSDLSAHEEAIVGGAQARRGRGSGRLAGALVDEVLAAAPLAPTAEQAAVIRGLTSSGRGVDSVRRWPRRARPSPLASSQLPGAVLRYVLEDPAEIAEADSGVHALGHLRRLKGRRLASARERVVHMQRRQRSP
jgi:hypothetical protein